MPMDVLQDGKISFEECMNAMELNDPEDTDEIPEEEFNLGLETMKNIAEAIRKKDYSNLPALAESLP